MVEDKNSNKKYTPKDPKAAAAAATAKATGEQSTDAVKTGAGTVVKVAEKIDAAENILVALSKNPSVDEIAAALGLTMMLDGMGKHATAIYSGETPNALEFLNPEKTFEDNTNSLQDFIIALNKEKADHLRYRIDGDFVKVYITPYKTTISEKDLEFSHGDYNVDLIVALDVTAASDLDGALVEHGRIMHDAGSINITTDVPGKFGEIEWSDPGASSVSEMVAILMREMGDKVEMSQEMATAVLTGIVAATDRFSNEKTTPNTMNVASDLMEAGADQQLISAHVMNAEQEEANELKVADEERDVKSDDGGEEEGEEETTEDEPKEGTKEEAGKEPVADDPTALAVNHGEEVPEESGEPVEFGEPVEGSEHVEASAAVPVEEPKAPVGEVPVVSAMPAEPEMPAPAEPEMPAPAEPAVVPAAAPAPVSEEASVPELPPVQVPEAVAAPTMPVASAVAEPTPVAEPTSVAVEPTPVAPESTPVVEPAAPIQSIEPEPVPAPEPILQPSMPNAFMGNPGNPASVAAPEAPTELESNHLPVLNYLQEAPSPEEQPPEMGENEYLVSGPEKVVQPSTESGVAHTVATPLPMPDEQNIAPPVVPPVDFSAPISEVPAPITPATPVEQAAPEAVEQVAPTAVEQAAPAAAPQAEPAMPESTIPTATAPAMPAMPNAPETPSAPVMPSTPTMPSGAVNDGVDAGAFKIPGM